MYFSYIFSVRISDTELLYRKRTFVWFQHAPLLFCLDLSRMILYHVDSFQPQSLAICSDDPYSAPCISALIISCTSFYYLITSLQTGIDIMFVSFMMTSIVYIYPKYPVVCTLKVVYTQEVCTHLGMLHVLPSLPMI